MKAIGIPPPGLAGSLCGHIPGGKTIRIGTVKYPRIVPKDDASAKLLAKRTLTNLYSERPAWLANALESKRDVPRPRHRSAAWPPGPAKIGEKVGLGNCRH